MTKPVIEGGTAEERQAVLHELERFGPRMLALAAEKGVRVVLLDEGQRYDSASASLLRMGVDVDSWPQPPAGLFVVGERSVYLRSRSSMTVAHEFGHAIDCALGGGIYHSGIDSRIKSLYSEARRFVTPYAASGIDEYFAESVRAYVEANDPASPWPPVSKERLRQVQPELYDYLEEIFQA